MTVERWIGLITVQIHILHGCHDVQFRISLSKVRLSASFKNLTSTLAIGTNMSRLFRFTTFALALSLSNSFVFSAPPRGGEKKPEPNKPKTEPHSESKKPEPGRSNTEPGKHPEGAHGNSTPGGNWSQPTHNVGKPGTPNNVHSGAPNNNIPGRSANSNATGAQGAAAGAAAANRNSSQVTGKEGAAAGAAISNRNAPKATGAEGAAAGAAAANRNSPQVSGKEGAAAGAAVANHNSPRATGAEGAAVGAAAVRSSYNNPHLYDQQWYAAHPGVWAPTNWKAGAVWAPATWATTSKFCGISATPVVYNYGTNVTCVDGNIALGGQHLGTAAEFSQQAATLAASGASAEVSNADEWMPLGIYGMVRNEQQHPQLILQLAMNKQGILRGNYTDELSEHTQPVQGSVDLKTQRAAWTVGDNNLSVIEAGLSNLSQDEAPVLIHKRGQTEHWILVRLNPPAKAE